MKIYNLYFGDKAVKQLNVKKTAEKVETPGKNKADTVIISGNANGVLTEDTLSVRTEFPPRTEKISEVRERISQGEYNSRLLRSVAEKMTESPAVQDVVTEVTMDRSKNIGERAEKVDKTREQAQNGFYDDPGVRRTIAERLVDSLGLTENINKLM